MTSPYEVTERCGCGASMSSFVYSSESAWNAQANFRIEHRHIEPPAPHPERVVIRIPRGAPRIRASRRLVAHEKGSA